MNIEILYTKSFVNNCWCESTSKEIFTVENPANGKVLARVPEMNKEDVKLAIKAAEDAFYEWSNLTAEIRSNYLKKWHSLVIKNQDYMAKLLTMEQGKTLHQSYEEVLYAATFIEWYAEECKRTYGDVIPSPWKNKDVFTIKQPIGVVAAITPWNFPVGMITRKCAPALASGCTVVLKPSEYTPLSALYLAHLAEEAGFPPGVLNIITTCKNSVEVGLELTTNKAVRKVSFTGSTQVGKKIFEQCSSTLKKVSLELGGNAPFIVFDDADLDLAVSCAMQSKLKNSGQTCVCPNRFFIHKKIYKQFLNKLTTGIKKLVVGEGMDIEVDIGPLINDKAVIRIESLVKDALENGANIVCGGKRITENYFEPTIIEKINSNMKISQDEIFGPVFSMFEFENVEELIKEANNTDYGLAVYFYTNDINKLFTVARRLEYGMIGINTNKVSSTATPFGGVKHSGIGREGCYQGIEEYLETKYVCVGSKD